METGSAGGTDGLHRRGKAGFGAEAFAEALAPDPAMTRDCNPIAPKSDQTLQGSCQPCPCETAVRSSRATSDPDLASADNLCCWLTETIASRVLSYAANQEPPEPANPPRAPCSRRRSIASPPVPISRRALAPVCAARTGASVQWHSHCNPKRQRGALPVYFQREFPR